MPPLKQSLTRNQLTAALILVTLLPFALVVVLYTTFPDHRDPILDADVRVGPKAYPYEGAENARVVPCAILKNPTSQRWENVNLSINDQFHYFHQPPIEPGEEVFIPLKFFHTKGNQFFPPGSQPLRKLTIYAQIPSGARAILEVDGDVDGN